MWKKQQNSNQKATKKSRKSQEIEAQIFNIFFTLNYDSERITIN